MFIYLVRHGETVWNAQERILGFTDVGLSEKGWAQVRALGEFFRDRPLRAVYTSDLKRAVDTASVLAGPHGLSVQLEPGLRELNQGVIEGLTFQQMQSRHPDLLRAWSEDPGVVRIPQGESLLELQGRAWSVVERLARANPEGTIVAVSHNLTILTLLCHLLELPIGHFRRLRQAAAAVNLIEFGELGWVLHQVNQTHHLWRLDGAEDGALRKARSVEAKGSAEGGST
jgi:broad specificity phosphatase PhoE